MNLKKYKALSNKVKKWASGKAEQDYEFFFLPAKKELELYLNQNNVDRSDLNKIIDIHASLGVYSSWHFTKFLECLLNDNDNDKSQWNMLVEAMSFRSLQFALGYSKPNHIAPFSESQIGLAICDSILLENAYAHKIICGYSEHEDRPTLNPQSVIQFSHNLFSLSAITTANENLIFRKPLADQYSQLLRAIKAENEEFQVRFDNACDYHMDRSGSSMDHEFSYESDMLVPSELIVSLKLRMDLGREIYFIDHPLAKPFVDFVSSLKNVTTSDFFMQINKKIELDFL